MEVAMEVKDHMPLAELKGLEGVEKDADRARRPRIVILAVEGWPAIAMAVGLTRRPPIFWVKRRGESPSMGGRKPFLRE